MNLTVTSSPNQDTAPTRAEARPESFSLDPATTLISRTVLRSDASLHPTTTIIGTAPSREEAVPIDAVADAVWLRAGPPAADRNGQTLRVADLFSGCGAMSLGIRESCRALRIPFEIAGAFDIDPHAIGIYARNFGLRGRAAEPCDLGRILSKQTHRKKLTQNEQVLRRRVGRVDLVVAGPPCQGNSDLNNRTRRVDPRNELYYCVARFARLFTPRWILIENVTSVTHDHGDVVARTKQALRKQGYEVVDGIVNLAHIGVPQTRKRHLLVAVLKRGRKRVPKALEALDKMMGRYNVLSRSVSWAIGDLRSLPWPKEARDTAAVPSLITMSRIDWLFRTDSYDLPDSKRPPCHRDKAHSYHAVYGRLRPDIPAPTITGGFQTMGRGRFVNPWERRTLTAHEAARLQFIPDWFDFCITKVPKSRLAEIIGNAVPPRLSYVLALELLR